MRAADALAGDELFDTPTARACYAESRHSRRRMQASALLARIWREVAAIFAILTQAAFSRHAYDVRRREEYQVEMFSLRKRYDAHEHFAISGRDAASPRQPNYYGRCYDRQMPPSAARER